MTDTTNLGLPCIEGSQAQKHITHNDALRILDTLVQLAVLTRTLNAPPASPSDGQRWIVKASGTGGWAGHDNAVAAWQDGAWQFSSPQTGWVAFVADEGTLVVWNGTAWGDFFSTVTAIQNLALLGIGTTADTTNVLAAKLNNTLFAAKTVAEGGSGDLRLKVSKASAANTASFLFQDNYSGRAEIGLTGDDDFHFKVSPDGTTWLEGIKISGATGKVSFPVTGGPRELLAANRTYYVRTDGSDSNNGLSNTSGGAFLTVQKAVDTVSGIDLGPYSVTIQLGAGTYTGLITLKSYVGAGPVTIVGDTATPSNVLFSSSTAGTGVIFGDTVVGKYVLEGFKLTSSVASQHGIYLNNGVSVDIQNLDFGALNGGRHMIISNGSRINFVGNYTVSGSANRHYNVGTGGIANGSGITVTVTGTPAFSGAFAYATRLGLINLTGVTFSGSATGARYSIDTNGVIYTGGAGASYFPGDSAGSTATGGQYA